EAHVAGDGHRSDRSSGRDRAAARHVEPADRDVAAEHAAQHVPDLIARAAQDPGGRIDFVECRKSLILLARADIAYVESTVAGSAELADVAAGTEHRAVDGKSRRKGEQVANGPGGELDRGAARTGNGAGVEYGRCAVAGSKEDSGDAGNESAGIVGHRRG